MRLAILLLSCAAGCGDNAAASSPCTATFAGGFTDTVRGPAACASLAAQAGSADQLLDFAIDSRVLGAQVIVSIDLGAAPATGEYSSETIGTWHAVEARSILDGACFYTAGDAITPQGSFMLTLDALDAATAHGVLDIVQYVHAVDGTDCGPSDTETIDVAF